MRSALASAFSAQPLEHWALVFDSSGPLSDACVTPVLSPAEGQAVLHRGVGIRAALAEAPTPLVAAQPVPRFTTGMPGPSSGAQPAAGVLSDEACIVQPGAHTSEVLAELGFGPDRISRMLESGVAMQAPPSERRARPRPKL